MWTHRIQGEAHGILFDLPHVVRDAPALIQARGLAERVTIGAGSFFERVPSGGDAYLLSHIIHDWSEEQCLAILDHCWRAMNSGSRLLGVEMVLPEGDTPHPGKIIDMAMLVVPGLSGAAVIDECGIAIGLVSMIPALQEDEEGAALEEGTFEREHSWSFMKRLVLASWWRYPRI